MSRKLFLLLALVALVGLMSTLLAACGGDDETDAGTGRDGGDSAADDKNDDNDDNDEGAGSGSRGDKYGSVTYAIGGNVKADGELPFVPEASIFADGSWALTFGEESGEAIMIINLSKDAMIVTFGDGKVTAIGIGSGSEKNCDIKVDRQDSDGASGSFDCKDAQGTSESGAVFADGVTMKGRFEARAK